MSTEYDVIIIGGGPGGYQAALRAGQLGLKVACIEKRPRLGGTCLNIGCIPSKALLESTLRYQEVLHGSAVHGIEVGEVRVNLPTLMAHKDKVVADLGNGITFLFRKHKVDFVQGTARLTAPNAVQVTPDAGDPVQLRGKAVVIATGSDVARLPGVDIDETRIVSSTGALSLPAVPRRLAVIGGGAIGLELGSVWRRLGAEVTVIEFLDRIAPGLDAELAQQMQKVLTRQGMHFQLKTKVIAARVEGAEVTLALESVEGASAQELVADVVLVAIGRRPVTAGLGLEELGVKLDSKGRIEVDPGFQTNVPGLYAIGDVIAGPMLAHKASEEGIVLMEQLAGMKPVINYAAIPNIIYTWPELAAVGRSEEELKAAGVAYKVGKFPFSANSRARAQADTDGLVKVLADAGSDRVLGVHMLGPDAGTLIHEAALALEFGAYAEDIARTVHAHPTLPEALKEAALAVEGRALHI